MSQHMRLMYYMLISYHFILKIQSHTPSKDKRSIPAAPAYGVYISQLIRYSRACGSYQDFLNRGLLLTRKLLNQGFLLVKLKSSLRKFYGLHHDLVDRSGISVTDDHRYVPFIVITTPFFPYPLLVRP